MVLLLSLLGSIVASASPVGDPIVNPVQGRLHLDAHLGQSLVHSVDDGCSGTACSARIERSTIGGELGLAILRGVGVYGFAARTTDQIAEASYKGSGRIYGGGIRLAVPLGRAGWVAVNGQIGRGQGQSDTVSEDGDPGRFADVGQSVSVLGVLGSVEGGGHGWLGVQVPIQATYTLEPLGREGLSVSLPLSPIYPASAVIGATLISERVGLPWRNSPRIRTSIEARIGGEMGVGLRTGLAF